MLKLEKYKLKRFPKLQLMRYQPTADTQKYLLCYGHKFAREPLEDQMVHTRLY
jgi:hypothetical protein